MSKYSYLVEALYNEKEEEIQTEDIISGNKIIDNDTSIYNTFEEMRFYLSNQIESLSRKKEELDELIESFPSEIYNKQAIQNYENIQSDILSIQEILKPLNILESRLKSFE